MTNIQNSINNTVGATNSGVTNTLTVQNPSNTASSQAQALITVGGTSSGDAWTQYTVGTTQSYAIGISNANSQELRITQAASGAVTPSTTTVLQQFDFSNTRAYFPIPLMALGGNTQGVGTNVDFNIQNTSTTAASDARVNIQVSNTGGGNSYLAYTGPADNWAVGVNKSASNAYEITTAISGAFPYSTVAMKATTAGAISFPAAGFTTGGVIVADAAGSGLISSTTAGTSGQVLTSNGAGVAPTFQTFSGSSKVVQMVYTSSATYVSTAANIPFDDTIPQNTEGAEIFTAAITPSSASNLLYFVITASIGGSTGNSAGIMALFQDTTANALAATYKWNQNQSAGVVCTDITLAYRMTAGTTSSTTFKVRIGSDSGTTYMNGSNTGRTLGGVQIASMSIWELTP